MSESNIEFCESTEGTEGTNHEADKTSPLEVGEGLLMMEAISPSEVAPSDMIESKIDRPCFIVHDDWFQLNGRNRAAGLYWHAYTKSKEPQPIDIWISYPIHAEANTSDEHGESFGLLLRFIDSFDRWREWAMPMYLLKGGAEEVRGELLKLGFRIDPDAKNYLNKWLMQQKPKPRFIAAVRTGWHCDNRSFVLPHKTIGYQNVRFQSELATHDNFSQQGHVSDWMKSVAQYCKGNPILILALSSAFAAPLLLVAKKQHTGGIGIHLVGQSSRGKTTALQVAASVWGGPEYVRTWRATSNGVEAIAAELNDALLILDEISECEPHEIGSIIYALANGQGKQRALRSGKSQISYKWRTIFLSSGERTLSAHMQEAGKNIKAGQEARLLDIPSTDRTFGAFDHLHDFSNGCDFSDHLKRETSQFYGTAGPEFIQCVLEDQEDLSEAYLKMCNLPEFSAATDGIENRASSMFALIALAGEKATEYGLTGWSKGDALQSIVELMKHWQDFRGEGQTETRQILECVQSFIERHGDGRFSGLHDSNMAKENDNKSNDNIDQKPIVRDRAGYWKDSDDGRVYLFNSSALKEAAIGYDLKFILRTLEESGWIVAHDVKRHSKKVRVENRSLNLYWILPKDNQE